VAGSVLVDMIADKQVQEFTELPCALVDRSSVATLG
jgi:hypothetical protein